jgi:hypothetical protein
MSQPHVFDLTVVNFGIVVRSILFSIWANGFALTNAAWAGFSERANIKMRISFVLQTYRSPDQIGRLVDILNRGCPDSLIVIAHSGPLDGLAQLARERRVARVLPAVPGRGGFSLVDSCLSALRWLRQQNVPYDWVVVLSEQDYPIRPLQEFFATLERSDVDGYFYFFDPSNERSETCRPMVWPPREWKDRYLFHYRLLKNELSTIERALLRLPRKAMSLTRNHRLHTSFGLALGRRVDPVPFSPDFRLYAGSSWPTFRRECGEALLDFVEERPDIVEYFRHVILPSEAFVPTVLLNKKTFRISPHELRYFDFSDGRHGYSKILGPADLEAAFASKCFFGRKFDLSVHPRILDVLDARALG